MERVKFVTMQDAMLFDTPLASAMPLALTCGFYASMPGTTSADAGDDLCCFRDELSSLMQHLWYLGIVRTVHAASVGCILVMICTASRTFPLVSPSAKIMSLNWSFEHGTGCPAIIIDETI